MLLPLAAFFVWKQEKALLSIVEKTKNVRQPGCRQHLSCRSLSLRITSAASNPAGVTQGDNFNFLLSCPFFFFSKALLELIFSQTSSLTFVVRTLFLK
jgi:hypothetical protein